VSQHNQTSGIQGSGLSSEEKRQAMPFMVGHADLVGTCQQGELRIPFKRVVEVSKRAVELVREALTT
jgi:hypothetical protein